MSTDVLLNDDPFDVAVEDEMSQLQIKTVITDMVEFTRSLVVDGETSYKKITSLYRQAREWKKVIDTQRKNLVEPYRKKTSEINDKAKELSDPLDNVIQMANLKANGYLRLLEQRKLAEDEKIKAAAALFDCADELYIPPMEKIIRGDGAVTVTKTENKFEILDISKVPLKYLMINEDEVRKDIKLGINEIPGLKIYKETTTQLRIR